MKRREFITLVGGTVRSAEDQARFRFWWRIFFAGR